MSSFAHLVSSTMYPSSVMPSAGFVSVLYASVFERHSEPPPPVRPGSRRPNVSPNTNQVLPSARNIEPRSCPATSTLPVLFGDVGPVNCETCVTFATPCSTNGDASPTGSMFTFADEDAHADIPTIAPSASRASKTCEPERVILPPCRDNDYAEILNLRLVDVKPWDFACVIGFPCLCSRRPRSALSGKTTTVGGNSGDVSPGD